MTLCNRVDYSLRKENMICMSVLSPYAILMLQYFILIVLKFDGTSKGSIVQVISKILVGLMFLISFSTVFKRRGSLFFVLYSISIIAFSLSYLIFPQNSTYLNSLIFKYFFICLPCFIYSYSIKDLAIFSNFTYKSSIVIYLLGLTLGILVLTKHVSLSTYSMTLSYYLLLPTIVFLEKLFSVFTLKHLIYVITSLGVMLALGSRGAIMCLALYVSFYWILSLRKVTILKVILAFLATASLLVIIIYFKEILMFFNNILLNHGIYSRSINLFLLDRVHLSGREEIYKVIIEQIKLHPVIGIGIAGDRLYLNGAYVHNFFLELISGFGIIIGPIVILYMGGAIMKHMLVSDNKTMKNLLKWLSIGFFPLFVSGSYLTDFSFWILLAFIVKRPSSYINNYANESVMS